MFVAHIFSCCCGGLLEQIAAFTEPIVWIIRDFLWPFQREHVEAAMMRLKRFKRNTGLHISLPCTTTLQTVARYLKLRLSWGLELFAPGSVESGREVLPWFVCRPHRIAGRQNSHALLLMSGNGHFLLCGTQSSRSSAKSSKQSRTSRRQMC